MKRSIQYRDTSICNLTRNVYGIHKAAADIGKSISKLYRIDPVLAQAYDREVTAALLLKLQQAVTQ